MGTFAETSIVDYLYRVLTKENKHPFPFAENQRKLAVFVFSYQETNGSCRFSILSVSIRRTPEMWRHGHGKFKRKTEPRKFSFINLSFVSRANENLPFVRLLV
jgi:hypothetical protein